MFKDLIKSLQIGERSVNLCKSCKEHVEGAKNSHRSYKIRPANRTEVEIQFRRDEESAEKAKEFQPLDLAQRIGSCWIREKVHDV